MAEYISRKEAKELHCKICKENWICYHSKENCNELKSFDGISAADVAPVRRGKWEPFSISTNGGLTRLLGYKCSVCGGFCVGESNFCHNCGAKMGVDECSSE